MTAVTQASSLSIKPAHLCRCWLFTPATKPERFSKARQAEADVLLIDLEDAVAPSDKDQARGTATGYLASSAPDDKIARALRINSLKTRAGLADVLALLDSEADPDFVVLPKTEAAAELRLLDDLLSAGKKQARLVAMIETAAALADLERIASATPRVVALLFGAADMAADLGADNAWEPLLGARQRIVAAASLSKITPIDTPFFDIHNIEGLIAETKRSMALGFVAKAAVNPVQIAPINAVFKPSQDAICHARRVLAENARGAGTVDGQMIDEAVARKARLTLSAVGESS